MTVNVQVLTNYVLDGHVTMHTLTGLAQGSAMIYFGFVGFDGVCRSVT